MDTAITDCSRLSWLAEPEDGINFMGKSLVIVINYPMITKANLEFFWHENLIWMVQKV